MRYLPEHPAVLSLPAGLLGYALGVVLLVQPPAPSLANGIVVLFVALFVAGLFMVPFVIPFIDRKAKQDLAAYRAQQGQPTTPTKPPSRWTPGRRRAAGAGPVRSPQT